MLTHYIILLYPALIGYVNGFNVYLFICIWYIGTAIYNLEENEFSALCIVFI